MMFNLVASLVSLFGAAAPASAQAPGERVGAVFAGGCFWCTESPNAEAKIANTTYSEATSRRMVG